MSDDGDAVRTPDALAAAGEVMARFRVLSGLIKAKVLTQQQASEIMIEIAHDYRSLTEEGPLEALGESIAGRHEVAAGWLLGLDPKL